MRLLAILLLAALLPAGEADVLLTGFRPFAGRPSNGSATMAAWLGRELGAGVQVEVMDCRWGEPEALLARLGSRKWRAVIGLGEGWPGLINVEQLARNRREGADEAKAQPPAAVIAEGKADLRRGLRLESAWFTELPTVADQREGLYGLAGVVLSSNAGTYLCNNAFYRYAELSVPVAGFIHVPIQGTTVDAEYLKRWGPTVRLIIERNLATPR